ncbi:hypothetical protein [Azospirillum thermophilum]|uniref:Flagellar hook-basal body complex protein FliE n=1 Tax=Azospirillum thermophilum TaxID=2202148 RepID=A0A2S2CQ35_9PROT|nr:hypothetical protein [Azospirillum thermophilum]AWK86569.1 hypothetical protein DEW08_10245 [Azospirillum thermophilum]
MDIGSVSSMPLPGQPQPAAVPPGLEGLQAAQARLDGAAERIAAGSVDPAVVLDISSARIDFAASAKVMEASQENTRRLLDMLA